MSSETTGSLVAIKQVSDNLNSLLGRILTVVDAVMPENPQSVALKMVVKNLFGDCKNSILSGRCGDLS